MRGKPPADGSDSLQARRSALADIVAKGVVLQKQLTVGTQETVHRGVGVEAVEAGSIVAAELLPESTQTHPFVYLTLAP